MWVIAITESYNFFFFVCLNENAQRQKEIMEVSSNCQTKYWNLENMQFGMHAVLKTYKNLPFNNYIFIPAIQSMHFRQIMQD